MDCMVHGAVKNWTRLSDFHFTRYVLNSGILGPVVALYLVLQGTSIMFSTVAVPIYTPTNSVEVLPFFQTPYSIYCL